MNANEQLIHAFYQAFQRKDVATMQGCYAEHAIFNDEAFTRLNAQQVRMMWEMLVKRGHDLSIEYQNVEADEVKGRAEWTATYTFSKSKRKVVNRIQAEFLFENGKIVQHTDRFHFHTWARQALGPAGLLLGWTAAFKRKVQEGAMKSLAYYMDKG